MKIEIFTLLLVLCGTKQNSAYKTFRSGPVLNNIAFHDKVVIVGAINNIYKLNENLVEIKRVSTGPQNDNKGCLVSDTDCVRTPTDNRNTVLLVVPRKNQYDLLTCGSVQQGTCKIRNVNNFDIIFSGQRAVGSNDNISSTVAFISLGPVVGGSPINVLNLAVNQFGRLNSMTLPSVSVRRYDELNSRRFLRVATSAVIEAARTFYIDYISGFSTGKASYLTSMRQAAVGSPNYRSQIVRFCPGDVEFVSYTEVPMVCRNKAGTNFNILIAGSLFTATGKTAQIFNVSNGEQVYLGVFSKTAGPGREQTDNNAICAFSVTDIDAAFLANIRECIVNGNPADGGLPWLKSRAASGCANAREIDETLKIACARLPFLRNFIQGGYIPLNHTHSFHIPGKPTAIKTYPHSRGFSFFVGNDQGILSKYSLSSSFKTHVYVEESVTKQKIRQVITAPNNNEFLYMLTRNEVVKSSIKDCSKRKSCIDCLAGPFCGWCSLQRKCTFKSECKNSEHPLYFVNDTDTKCPALVSIAPKPAAIPVRIESKITWKINNLPVLQPGEEYSCLFGDKTIKATVSGNEYTCVTPKYGEIAGTDTATSKVVKVTFKSPYNQISLFSVDVDFYNCGVIESCLKCTKFKHKCNWCSSSLTCLDDGKSCASPTLHAGPEQTTSLSKCPRVTGINTLYVSNGVERQITFPGVNFPEPKAGHNFQCRASIEGAATLSTAKRKDAKTVICDKKKYTFKKNDANYTAEVSVLYGGKKLDSAVNTKITIYKCEVKREDCSICLDAPKAWQCGWCGKKYCAVSDACSSNWVNGSCPSPPRITSISPTSGAIYGSTKLTIKGRDLGTTKADIGNITVAGKPCTFLRDLYVPSNIIYCETSAVSKEISGVVQVYVKFGEKMMKIQSSTIFMYKKPSVTKFAPTKAPCSGGTVLTIFGNHLNVGANIVVTAAGKSCILKNRTPTKIYCTISSSCQSRKRRALPPGSVVVSFDGKAVLPKTSATFDFKPDPVISSVSTYKLGTVDANKPSLETFVSGGQVFIVKGERFDLIQQPKMKFTVLSRKKSKFGPCQVKSPTIMNCIAPNITDVTGAINATTGVELGFVLQNVISVQKFRNITVGPDPVFFEFGEKINLETRNLVLVGKNLHVLGNEDVNVTVANLPCVVQNIRDTLFCIAPNISMVKKHKDAALVKVQVGKGGLQYTLGYVRYVRPKIITEPFPWLYIYIAAAIAVVFITVIIILVVLYRRRQKKEKKYEKVYQTRLDNLESRYARECKEAFAELQTEMTDLTTDMSTSAIPYLDFETYAVRLLFPGLENHPVTEKDCNKSDTWKRCMSSFCELLKEKEFLLIFVKTLESQQLFVMRDRCKVASLLMVSLQDDIKYITDILQELLSDLIEKSVDSGRGKLLLRRTESVAEKLLTNWLAYTLHEFSQQRVGEPLFRLFSAIGSLLEKEPVDTIACEARNSLSEDRLLRQKVDFKTITAHVEYDGDDSISVQLLNCDSINQAKEKILNFIYKNVPFSQRPNKDSLVLVYLTPTGGEKILHQEDSTCEIEGEWKRINTLEHFLIPDGCQLKLVPFSIYSDGTGTPVFNDTSMPNVAFAPTHSSTPMLNSHHHHLDEDYKLWHLVKSSDYPQEQKEDVRQNKMMAEVYLTRLLKTKGTLQNFVDELFDAVFSVTKRGLTIPPAMKFLFDFLDKQAALLGVTDSEVLHTWKNNSLPLKFWINIIKNPNFVFDIHKTSIVDSCLSVTAQLFMDSCSPEEHRLGKDSPSNKLLYAKEIPEYKKKVARFYSDVKLLPAAKDKELNESFLDISNKYGSVFNHYNAASDMMTYAVKYKVKIMDALENEDLEEYADKLQKIMETLPDE